MRKLHGVAERRAALVVDEEEGQPVRWMQRGQRGDQRLQQLALARSGHAGEQHAQPLRATDIDLEAALRRSPDRRDQLVAALQPALCHRRAGRLGELEQLQERDARPDGPVVSSAPASSIGASSRATSSAASAAIPSAVTSAASAPAATSTTRRVARSGSSSTTCVHVPGSPCTSRPSQITPPPPAAARASSAGSIAQLAFDHHERRAPCGRGAPRAARERWSSPR